MSTTGATATGTTSAAAAATGSIPTAALALLFTAQFELGTAGFVLFGFLDLVGLFRLPFGQAFGYSRGDVFGNDGDRLGRVIVGRNSVVHSIGVAVGVDHPEGGDPKFLGFGQADVLVADVHQ